MNIVMLGHSGVGKTSLMACMYLSMSNEVKAEDTGFRFVAVDPKDHAQLLKVGRQIYITGDYPSRTAFSTAYKLALQYRGAHVMEFTWTDYRGGALVSDDEEELKELMEDLSQADAILAFFDATELCRDDDERSEEIGRLTAILGSAVGSSDRTLPLSLVLTKSDQLSSEQAERAHEPLENLIEAISHSKKILGSLIFTACGRGVLQNAETPALYSLHRGIGAHLKRLYADMETRIESAKRWTSQSGFFDSLFCTIKGEPSAAEMADYVLDKAREVARQHDALVEPVNALLPRLQHIYTF